ncbi:MAG: M15 family metallopeptidase [Lachnospiraceae bacterium]
MKKRNQTILIRNLGLLLLFIIICAVLARHIHGGETLSEYSESHSNSTEISDEPTDVHTDSDTSVDSGTSSGVESPEKSGIYPDTSNNHPETETEDLPMADRITYQNGFYYESLSESIKNRITGISYPADDSTAQIHYDDLRYVSVLYYNFNDKEKVGELICNKEIAQDLVEIFYELYVNHYQIEKINLVDEYSGDDELSMKDNNTSCFNYRTIEGKDKLSNHSYGLAIDLNPFFNPYVTYPADGSIHVAPEGSEYYADRSKEFAYKITRDDLAYTLFTEHGFTWGGNWNSSKDYQHFEKKL